MNYTTIICILIFVLSIKKLIQLFRGLVSIIEDELRHIKLYRRLRGGIWYHYKLGRGTPYIKLFSYWTKHPYTNTNVPEMILLDIENYSNGESL